MYGTRTKPSRHEPVRDVLILSSFFPDGASSLATLLEALHNLDDLCLHVDESYKTSLSNGVYEKWDEKS